MHDLWFGQGFCHGQDRLWQIDLYRRIGSGRLSEIAGTAGLVTDRFMRTLGLRRVAEREAAGARAGHPRPRSTPSAPASTRPPPIARSRSSSSSFACASSRSCRPTRSP